MSVNRFHQLAPILDVRKVSDAIRYYVERLGFAVAFRYEADPDNYAGVFRDDVQLHMQWQAEEQFAAGRAGNLRVRIAVDDPDALYHEFLERGAFPPETALHDTDWGTREFGFRDPDGNGLAFYRSL